MPAFFRRRTLWLPTFWGLLGFLALAAMAASAWAHWIGEHLAGNDPALGADGRGARMLVVEGWLGERGLDAAVRAMATRRYERVVVTGGPFDDSFEERRFATYAERAADYLRRKRPGDPVAIAVPAPASAQDRTYLSAAMVRDWAEKTGTPLDAIDLFSSGVHARRSRIVFRMALGPTAEVGILAARPTDYELDRWWTTSAGAKAVIGETLSIAWTYCCFWPAPRGSFSERWAVPEQARQSGSAAARKEVSPR